MSLADLKKFVKDKMKEDHYVDPRDQHQRVLPSGYYRLDHLLAGGLRSGTYVELFGPPASGKTFHALNFAAQGQKIWEKPVLYMDFERAWNADRAEQIGVDLDYVVRALPPTQEDGFDLLREEIESDMYSVIIVDSVSAMLPDYEKAKKMGDQTVALNARVNSKGFRVITPGLANSVVIFINQLRENVGVMFGNPDTTTGGRSIPYYMHHRLAIGKNALREKDEIPFHDSTTGSMGSYKAESGHVMRIKLEKSRFNAPGHKADLIYSYALNAIDRVDDVMGYLKDPEVDLLQKGGGGWLEVDGWDKRIRQADFMKLVADGDPQIDELLARTPLGASVGEAA